jgi:acyl-CoA synthetase (AMP-forming)/AMP-acid ligase II
MTSDNLKLPLLNNYIDHWAAQFPDKAALIQHEDGKTISYARFASLVDYFALRLMDMGIEAGDRVATMLVLVPEHVILWYACFKIGAIMAPLDVRLGDEEVVRDLAKIEPKAFFFLGETPVRDFRQAGRAVQEQCPYVQHLIQFTPDPQPGDILEGATSITAMMDKKRLIYLKLKDAISGQLKKRYAAVEPRTPALIIYTTGTTGEPKPALLSHENIIVQNEILARGSGLGSDTRLLVNLPPSHVGCVTEGVMTTLYIGGTVVMLRIFDVGLTLEAIEQRQVNTVGMIPTQFRMLWAHPDYEQTDLSSLESVVYGGSSVDVAFLKRLAAMAPRFGTGIGMTETAGFASFTPPGISVEEMAGQVGAAFPELAPITIRAPMNEDGSAGDELADGDIGEICYEGPIVFRGFYNQPEATARMISCDGYLYSGDLGYFKDMGAYRALYLTGRAKFVIKQKGFNVFPGEVEDHIARLAGVDMVEVVGMPHTLYDEGIVAFVRAEEGADLTPGMVMAHCQSIASYKRPEHVEIWPPDAEFPLTRVAKVDKMGLQRTAGPIVDRLRAEGKWDAGVAS